MNKKSRLAEIDAAKGLAMFLVVVGHVVARKPPEENDWYVALKAAIYLFHMPFFMYLSGYIFEHAESRRLRALGYLEFVKAKAARFIPAFIVFGTITLVGKYVAERFFYVDNQVESIPHDFIQMFVAPGISAAASLWFIYVLFQFYVFFPLLQRATRDHILLVLLVCGILHFSPGSSILMINRSFEYAIYFAIGIYSARNSEFTNAIMDRFWPVFALAFSSSFWVTQGSPPDTAKLIVGLLSIPALHSLMRLSPFHTSKLLLVLGGYSFAIYLMNTITIGLTKALMFLAFDWHGQRFLFYFPILVLAGCAGPILLRKFIFSRSNFLTKMTS